MKPARLIYGCADIAAQHGVARSTVAMWLARYSDTPVPEYVTSDGRAFWTAAGMRAWHRWRDQFHDIVS